MPDVVARAPSFEKKHWPQTFLDYQSETYDIVSVSTMTEITAGQNAVSIYANTGSLMSSAYCTISFEGHRKMTLEEETAEENGELSLKTKLSPFYGVGSIKLKLKGTFSNLGASVPNLAATVDTHKVSYEKALAPFINAVLKSRSVAKDLVTGKTKFKFGPKTLGFHEVSNRLLGEFTDGYSRIAIERDAFKEKIDYRVYVTNQVNDVYGLVHSTSFRKKYCSTTNLNKEIQKELDSLYASFVEAINSPSNSKYKHLFTDEVASASVIARAPQAETLDSITRLSDISPRLKHKIITALCPDDNMLDDWSIDSERSRHGWSIEIEYLREFERLGPMCSISVSIDIIAKQRELRDSFRSSSMLNRTEMYIVDVSASLVSYPDGDYSDAISSDQTVVSGLDISNTSFINAAKSLIDKYVSKTYAKMKRNGHG